jgi:non-ribosomal peptide synthetase component F
MAGSASAHQAATATREQSSQQRAGRTRRTSAEPQRGLRGPTAAAADAPAALQTLSRLQQRASASPQVAQLRRLQALADRHYAPVAQLAGAPEEKELVQGQFATAELQPQLQQAPRANNNGLPDQLKSGIESLSGMSMDHVRVHLNSSQPAQLKHVLEHSDTRLVFCAHEFVDRLRVPLEQITASGERDIALFPLNPDQIDIFDDPYIAHVPLPPVGESDEALLMYTSGTSGVPTAVVQTHRALVSGGMSTSDAHALGATDRVLCALPLDPVNGQIVTTVAPLVHGGSVVMPHRFSASSFWQLAASHHCTWINVVPAIIDSLLDGPQPRAIGLDVSAIRFCRCASAPLSPEQHRAFEAKFGIGVIEAMGLTGDYRR